MRAFFCIRIAVLAFLLGVHPAMAQVNGDDLLRLGIQILGGAAQPPARLEGPVTPRRSQNGVRLRQQSGSAVEIQHLLNQLGYAAGAVDGRIGSRTRQAIMNFQRDYGLAPTGRADARLLQALRQVHAQGGAGSNGFAQQPGFDGNATRPSFDCNRARQPSERAICQSGQLSALDNDLADAYAAAAASGAASIDDQMNWIARRNSCGGNAACIETSYRQRLAELGGSTGQFAPPDDGNAGGGTFTLLDGYDLPYGDYRSGIADRALAGIGPQGCQQACATEGRCRGYTYNLRADICILKDKVGQQSRYAGAVSGIKSGETPAQPDSGTLLSQSRPASGYGDFVRLALMSDMQAYLADAGRTGIAYIRATGTEEQCRELFDVSRGDEFTRRDYVARAANVARGVIADLPGKPRRLTVPLEATYRLADYDFERQGFAFADYQSTQTIILAAGAVPLVTEQRPAFCRTDPASLHMVDGKLDQDYGKTNFNDLTAEHAALKGVDFLPIPPDEGRALRESGGGNIVLKATMIVEPRDQGRGPLKGRIVTLSAHDPSDGKLIYQWQLEQSTPGRSTPIGRQVAWTGDLFASMVAPLAEQRADRKQFDAAATRYFERYRYEIDRGNVPPQSPLPLDVMRGKEPAVIAVLNRDRLHAAVRDGAPTLPIAVAIEQKTTPWYEEETGLYLNKIENDLSDPQLKDPFSALRLSSRDLPLYTQPAFVRPWENVQPVSFKEVVTRELNVPAVFEFDRIVSLKPVPMGIEEAAARGLIGNTGNRSVILRWDLEITDIRDEKDGIVIGVTFRGLSYRWESDGTVIGRFTPDMFPTVASLREAADAALPPKASADNIHAPPPFTILGAEMMDLLQLRFAPDKVDDAVMQRMMITRFAYEAATQKSGNTRWGRFYRDVSRWPSPQEYTERLGEFRRWSEARAAALPEVLTISLPLVAVQAGRAAPYQRGGQHPFRSSCDSARRQSNEPVTQKKVLSLKLCDFLEAAWNLPEPVLYYSKDTPSSSYYGGPRALCGDDPYCRAMRDARSKMKLPLESQDFIQVDRLPVIEPAKRDGDAEIVIEIDVRMTGGAARNAWPQTIWKQAETKAAEFDRAEALNIARQSQERPPNSPVMLFQAETVAARLADGKTRAKLADLPLAAPDPLPLDLLDVPESKSADLDILGIRLGMSFEEADKIIRDHMPVLKVLTADRKRQLGTVSGEIVPYSSGRIYASGDNNEMIAIFDEPPAAPNTVLGMWRILRLPGGSTDPSALKATLTERYGPPRSVQEVSLPMMKKGLAFLWSDYADPSCTAVEFGFQQGLWQDENGDGAWLPPFMTQQLYPILLNPFHFTSVTADRKRPLAEFCSTFLGVRFANHDGANYQAPAGDEILTWLSDNRRYAELYYESRDAPVADASPTTDKTGTAKIKF